MRKRLIRISILSVIVMTMVFSMSSINYGDVFNSGRRKIVVFQQGISDPIKKRVVLKHNCTFVKNLRLVNAAVVILPALPEQAEATKRALLREKNVVRIDNDLLVKAIGVGTSKKPEKPGRGKEPSPQPAQILPWGVDRIDAEVVFWNQSNSITGSITGSGVKVAILDTGIDMDHPDLKENIKGGVNIINSRKSYDDDNGHGTHCAGIVAAIDNEIGVIGVAPQASLYAVKVLDRRGSGWLSDVIEGLQWCIDNETNVINESFGSSSGNESFYRAIKGVHDAGITQVAAAGNNYGGPLDYPAAYFETIAVTASDKDDNFASFSSKGDKVDLIAPGVDIYSTYKGEGYKTLSGTSMAAPHVTGTVALVLEKNPSLSPDDVRARLTDTAEWLNDLTLDQQGAGLVDAEKAAIGTDTGNNLSLQVQSATKVGVESKTNGKERLTQTKFGLSQNYPNPFNPKTTIEFNLPESSHVTLKIYNVAGELVKILIDKYQTAGYHQVTWYGDNEAGETVANGVYFYRLQAGDNVDIKKMVVLTH